MSDGSVALQRDSQRGASALALLSDDRLGRMAAKGSTAAFSTVYRRHHQAIYRYCLSIVGNEHDARDALQETMASALRAIKGEERAISLRPWLFRIAHNEAITVLRKKRRETPVEEIYAEAGDGGVGARDELRELLDDLGLLTARQRSALVMRELSGLSFDEIGAALDVSPVGAKQAVYEARCALQELREGRRLDCVEVREKVSADDRRLLRARRVRAHLRSCEECREFEEEIRSRRDRFGAIAPLPAPVALGILHGLLGGGSGGGGIAIGAGASFAGIAKLGVAGVIAIGVGAGALEIRDGGNESAAAAEERTAQPAAAEAGTTAAPDVSNADAAPAANLRESAKEGKGPGDDGGHGQAENGGQAGAHGQDAAAEPSQSGVDVGEVTPAAAANDGNNGNGPASTPPGQGGTPPGQGGVPPGLGTAPPGHGGTPPGQSTTSSPGNSGQAPGQTGQTPGQTGQTPADGATPPGQTPGATPGNSDQAPGHSGDGPPGQSAD